MKTFHHPYNSISETSYLYELSHTTSFLFFSLGAWISRGSHSIKKFFPTKKKSSPFHHFFSSSSFPNPLPNSPFPRHRAMLLALFSKFFSGATPPNRSPPPPTLCSQLSTFGRQPPRRLVEKGKRGGRGGGRKKEKRRENTYYLSPQPTQPCVVHVLSRGAQRPSHPRNFI